MKGVANARPGPYSYHCIIITAACSVGVTEAFTSACCYLMPTISFYVVNHKRKLLELEMCRIDCGSNSLSS